MQLYHVTMTQDVPALLREGARRKLIGHNAYAQDGAGFYVSRSLEAARYWQRKIFHPTIETAMLVVTLPETMRIAPPISCVL